MKIPGRILAECKCSSHFANVKGSKMHYLEEGTPSDEVFLFLHGMPTSSYLWRNIIPALSEIAHCIAPDLIGMGQSDKPDIDYTVKDHIEYIEEFIRIRDLKNITLVMHGWGSVIGLDYARRHASNIKSLVFYESYLQPKKDWQKLSLPLQQLTSQLELQPSESYHAVIQQNFLIDKILQMACSRKLTPLEIEEYRKPFPTPESRKPLWQFVQELPLGKRGGKSGDKGRPDYIQEIMTKYSEWLQMTTLPKLMIYGIPGFMTTVEDVRWARTHLKNLTQVELYGVYHFPQETSPELFAERICNWHLDLTKSPIEISMEVR